MSASIYTTSFQSADGVGFPLNDLSTTGGVFSPASPIQPRAPQQVIPVGGVSRAAMRIEDIYINANELHNLELFYRPTVVTALPSAPGSANNDTVIYKYAGRTDCNPFHQDDDDGRRLKKLVFGDARVPPIPLLSGIPTGGGGTLQFRIPAFQGIVKVTIQWSFLSPGGGTGT